MDEGARFFASDPAGVVSGSPDFTVEGHGSLQCHKGRPSPDVGRKILVDLPAGFFPDAAFHFDFRLAQDLKAASRDFWIGILHAGHNAGDTGSLDGVDARASASG